MDVGGYVFGDLVADFEHRHGKLIEREDRVNRKASDRQVIFSLMERAIFRTCEVLVIVARLFSPGRREAALGAAMALGRLVEGEDGMEDAVRLARASMEACQ
jgi:hypothetical protein